MHHKSLKETTKFSLKRIPPFRVTIGLLLIMANSGEIFCFGSTFFSKFNIYFIALIFSLHECFLFEIENKILNVLAIGIKIPSLFRLMKQNSLASCLLQNWQLYLFLFSFRKNLFDVFWRKTNWTLSQMGVYFHLTIHKQGYKKREIVVVNIF